MAITYSVTECETEIGLIDAQLKELRGLPTRGSIGKDSVDLSGTMKALRDEREIWVQRLVYARTAVVPRARRVI